MTTAERAHAGSYNFNPVRRELLASVLWDDQLISADHDFTFFGKIQRHNGNLFTADIFPDVQLRPVGKRKDADALAFIDPAVKEVPQLWPLIFRVPLAKGIAKGKNALLGARLFLIPARSADCSVNSILRQRIEQGLGLEQGAAFAWAQPERISAHRDGLMIGMDYQLHAQFAAGPIAKLAHFPEFISSIDMHERKGNRSWIKCFLGQTKHDRRVFADGIQESRAGKLCRRFTKNIDALGFKSIKMGQIIVAHDYSRPDHVRKLRILGKSLRAFPE